MRARVSLTGQLASVTDPAGLEWRYGYDLLGRQTSAHHPDKGGTTATFELVDSQVLNNGIILATYRP